MVTPSKGYRKRTRRKLAQKMRHKFKPEQIMKEFKPREKVVIIADPAVHKGLPHPRFVGSIGYIIEQRGQSYIICVLNGDKEKTLTVSPHHIKKIRQHA
jgi:large subunit ribosomal protein L21e